MWLKKRFKSSGGNRSNSIAIGGGYAASRPKKQLDSRGAETVAIEIDWLGGNCPVQAVGKIDGEPFYFRARGEFWSLSIGSEEEDNGKTGVHGRDVVGSPSWEYEEDYGDGPYDAGWMKEDVARQMIEKAAKIWRDS